ncbi:MAG TPA: lyase [Gemmatimonadota bacterium]|jgi:virginiamycin B lyase
MIAFLIPLVAATACGTSVDESDRVALAAADTVEIREWTVPWPNTRPRDPIVDREGHVWFVGQRGNYLGMLDPTTGEITRRELPANALPHNVIVGPDGALWYAGNGDSHIGRIDPASGDLRRYDTPVRDPHTLQFAPDGMLWFTAQSANRIGRLDPSTGAVTLVEPSVADARPYGLVIDRNGRPWIALFGTNRLATVDPTTMEPTEFPLPSPDSRVRRLGLTTDGMVWYVDYARGTIGRLDPGTGETEEWVAPGGKGSRPYAMAIDDRDRIWFVETGSEPNRLVGFDPATGAFTAPAPIESGGGVVRHMIFHAPTRTLWFGTDANTIGQARIGS